jgi:hypothetical protein
MAIRYDDHYVKVDGQWYFARRKERHWYAAGIDEHPQLVSFDSWGEPDVPPVCRNMPRAGPPSGLGPTRLTSRRHQFTGDRSVSLELPSAAWRWWPVPTSADVASTVR